MNLNSFESDINWLSNQLNSAHSFPIGSLSLETSATALCGRYVIQSYIDLEIDITKASYASWSSSCFSKEYARGWTRGFPDTIRVNPPPPWRLVTLRSWVQPPLRPSSQKQWYLQCFLHYPGKMHILEVFRLPFHLGCLDHLQIQHEEKGFMVSASSNMAVLASIWGACFFLVRFKLPFHALPLLSPHPASFRSFTPGGLKYIYIYIYNYICIYRSSFRLRCGSCMLCATWRGHREAAELWCHRCRRGLRREESIETLRKSETKRRRNAYRTTVVSYL